MLIDSHCHLNCIDLTEFNHDLNNVLKMAQEQGVEHFLCVGIELHDYPILYKLAETYPNISISIGLHPNNAIDTEPSCENLCALATHPACIAIGETGLDYYRMQNPEDTALQRQRFLTHIQAGLRVNKPLIVHMRSAGEDTIDLLTAEKASNVGGVMHCFAETWEIAKRALDLNFYISFSGIITFKNASALQEVAKKVPIERLLVETDAPYLAPVPYRGKQNHPALVKYVAMALSELRQMRYEDVARQTTENFKRCFRVC